MQYYVTAIRVAVSHKTAVRFAFAFSPIEAFEFHENFYRVFRYQYEINFCEFPVESNQDSGLWKFSETHGMKYRFCSQDFLAPFGDSAFGCCVQCLVKCVDFAEFTRLGAAFCKPLYEVISARPESMLIRAPRECAKAGLAIDYRAERFRVLK
jgi:hypothetical protein